MDVEEDSRGEINGEEANVTSLIHWCWSLLLTFESWMFVGQMSVHDNNLYMTRTLIKNYELFIHNKST